MTNPQKRVMYMERLPKEVGALLRGNGLVGLTEINQHWYRWLTTEFAGNGTCPSFAAGQKWRHRHDGNDCAIFWDSEIVQELNWNQWTLCYASHEIPAGSVAAKYDWRGFMSVEFQSVAPPHVRFIAAIVHNPCGQKKDGPRQTNMGSGNKATNAMANIAMRGMEKLLQNHHVFAKVSSER